MTTRGRHAQPLPVESVTSLVGSRGRYKPRQLAMIFRCISLVPE
jgi:hypothetical protein